MWQALPDVMLYLNGIDGPSQTPQHLVGLEHLSLVTPSFREVRRHADRAISWLFVVEL